jgi:hypothetical protein
MHEVTVVVDKIAILTPFKVFCVSSPTCSTCGTANVMLEEFLGIFFSKVGWVGC